MSDHLSADFKAAQAAGHHKDCDGYRLDHRVQVERMGSGMHRAVCEKCGPLHAGYYGASYSALDVARMHGSHAMEVACDGRCRDWDKANER